MNQGIQHPLAQALEAQLEAANLMVLEGRWRSSTRASPAASRPTPPSTSPPRSRSEACQTAVLTLGGMGYAQEYHVERYLRESYIPRIAPVGAQLIMCHIAEGVLGLPKSYWS